MFFEMGHDGKHGFDPAKVGDGFYGMFDEPIAVLQSTFDLHGTSLKLNAGYSVDIDIVEQPDLRVSGHCFRSEVFIKKENKSGQKAHNDEENKSRASADHNYRLRCNQISPQKTITASGMT